MPISNILKTYQNQRIKILPDNLVDTPIRQTGDFIAL